jgi:hypothetical protein
MRGALNTLRQSEIRFPRADQTLLILESENRTTLSTLRDAIARRGIPRPSISPTWLGSGGKGADEGRHGYSLFRVLVTPPSADHESYEVCQLYEQQLDDVVGYLQGHAWRPQLRIHRLALGQEITPHNNKKGNV